MSIWELIHVVLTAQVNRNITSVIKSARNDLVGKDHPKLPDGTFTFQAQERHNPRLIMDLQEWILHVEMIRQYSSKCAKARLNIQFEDKTLQLEDK